MKRYVKNNIFVIDVEIEAAHPIFEFLPEVAASHDLSKYEIPDREVIAKDQGRITRKMEQDLASCMEAVEDFCQENLGLIGTYKNVSEDNSYYYNYLATDENGDIIIDYRMRLRISNHEAHSSTNQKHNKKIEEQSDKLKDLLSYDEIRKLRKYPVSITVNNEEFDNYGDAVDSILDEIEAAIEVMKKNVKYRKKKAVPERYKNQKGFDVILEAKDSSDN